MTLNLLRQCGIPVTEAGARIGIGFKPEATGRIEVEPDWSAAAFWYCMLAASDSGEVFFPGLKRTGLQGDEIAADLFISLGIVTEDLPDGTLIRKSGPFTDVDSVDFTGCPDLALPVIVACALTGRRMHFKGLERLAIKESDRLAALGREFQKTGITLVQSRQGTWELDGTLRPGYEVLVDDYEDHRVAMAFSSLAIKGFRVVFSNSDVVSKSYPSFWKDLHSAGFEIVNPVENI
jgi:3-phosphoshikimate 1-carboxyvinyltransferase